MWLLNTKRTELKEFVSPEKAPPYAILSHTWSQDETRPEQTFQEVQAICKRYSESPEHNPRDLLCEKIRRCCELAEADGYEWVWIDTCCIDQSSSAELSEAINSMFRYYACSRVCYVYLENWDGKETTLGKPKFSDVERGSFTAARPVLSLVNRWFSRGWTLQELIAPDFVLFLDSKWIPRGSKVDFAKTIEGITDIPSELLSLSSSLGDYNVAERMSWAAHRETTREEDEAYCLLGIFGINLPPLYGEGRRAFRRLQEALLRQNPDPTLFCCGTPLSLKRSAMGSEPPTHAQWVGGYLLVDRPRHFEVLTRSAKIAHTIPECMRELGQGFRPFALSMTPYGIEACIPLCHMETVTLADFGYRRHDGVALYVPLLPDRRNSAELNIQPLYHVALTRDDDSLNRTYTDLPDRVLILCDDPIEWDSPKKVVIVHNPPLLSSGLNPNCGLGFAHSTRSPFRLDPLALVGKRLDGGYGHEQDYAVAVPTRFISVWEPYVSPAWRYQDMSNDKWGVARVELAADLVRVLERPTLNFVVQLGLCAVAHVDGAHSKSNAIVHWARVDEVTQYGTRINGDGGGMHWHNCDEDHISAWVNLSKTFKFSVSPASRLRTEELLLVTLQFKALTPSELMVTLANPPAILWMEPPNCVNPEATTVADTAQKPVKARRLRRQRKKV